MTNTSNILRKVKALAMKTVANGCTADEAVAAANTASRIIRDHGLDASLISWPAAPEGFAWKGDPGKGGQMEKLPEAAKPKATKAKDEKPKPPRKRKPAEPKPPRQTKAARVVEMLKRKQGVTIEQLMAEFGSSPTPPERRSACRVAAISTTTGQRRSTAGRPNSPHHHPDDEAGRLVGLDALSQVTTLSAKPVGSSYYFGDRRNHERRPTGPYRCRVGPVSGPHSDTGLYAAVCPAVGPFRRRGQPEVGYTVESLAAGGADSLIGQPYCPIAGSCRVVSSIKCWI
jgi:hypothetical protein